MFERLRALAEGRRWQIAATGAALITLASVVAVASVVGVVRNDPVVGRSGPSSPAAGSGADPSATAEGPRSPRPSAAPLDTPRRPPTPKRPGETRAAPRTDGGTPDSILRRRQSPPDGVANVVAFFGGGGDGGLCGGFDEVEVDRPTVRVPGIFNRLDNTADPSGPGSLERGRPDGICPLGFREGAPVRVSVSAPDGAVVSHLTCIGCSSPANEPMDAHLPWLALPGEELGTYQVKAEQGELAAAGSFELVETEGRALAVRESWALTPSTSVPRGTTIHIGLSGFRPDLDVDILLYYGRREERRGRFIGAVPLVTDYQGQALYALATRSDDPVGCYAVRSRPEVDVERRDAFYLFCLR